jgi:hypothetical protein
LGFRVKCLGFRGYARAEELALRRFIRKPN